MILLPLVDMIEVNTEVVSALIAVHATKMVELLENLLYLAGSLDQRRY